MDDEQRWMITCAEGYYWSKGYGWTTKSEGDTFDNDEKSMSALPKDGRWILTRPINQRAQAEHRPGR